MTIQTSTLGYNEYVSNVLIGEMRYTAEHSAPCIHLIERHKLAKGQRSKRFPKFGQATMSALTEGQDLIDSEDFSITYVEAEPSEVGGKFIITDKASREEIFDVFKAAGQMLGDGMGRKRDEDIIALFSALDNTFGGDNKYLGNANASGCVSNVRGLKFKNPVVAVHHPNALGYLSRAASTIGAAWAGMPEAFAVKALADFFSGMKIGGVPFYEDGNIAKISSYDSGYGGIWGKGCMGIVEELSPTVKRETDISLRATEIVVVADYIAVEIDGGYGASMQYEIGANATNA